LLENAILPFFPGSAGWAPAAMTAATAPTAAKGGRSPQVPHVAPLLAGPLAGPCTLEDRPPRRPR
jgi:hypothetical protein